LLEDSVQIAFHIRRQMQHHDVRRAGVRQTSAALGVRAGRKGLKKLAECTDASGGGPNSYDRHRGRLGQRLIRGGRLGAVVIG
jgi:hypothetical protein